MARTKSAPALISTPTFVAVVPTERPEGDSQWYLSNAWTTWAVCEPQPVSATPVPPVIIEEFSSEADARALEESLRWDGRKSTVRMHDRSDELSGSQRHQFRALGAGLCGWDKGRITQCTHLTNPMASDPSKAWDLCLAHNRRRTAMAKRRDALAKASQQTI